MYVGPDKAGSSWLHEVLLTHPQVFMPVAKDLYFFDRYYDRGLDWYLSQFESAQPSEVVVGEVCQDYLFCAEAPKRIAESLGSSRFMVTLRDPADRAFSSYLYMLKQGERPGTFLEALDSRPELIDHGRYASGIKRFTDQFGQESIYIAVFDDLASDPQAFIDRLRARAKSQAPVAPRKGNLPGVPDLPGTPSMVPVPEQPVQQLPGDLGQAILGAWILLDDIRQRDRRHHTSVSGVTLKA